MTIPTEAMTPEQAEAVAWLKKRLEIDGDRYDMTPVPYAHARALLAAVEEREGWRLVPVEPTEKMITAYVTGVSGAPRPEKRMRDMTKEEWFAMHCEKAKVRWKAMLSTAPLPAAPGGKT